MIKVEVLLIRKRSKHWNDAQIRFEPMKWDRKLLVLWINFTHWSKEIKALPYVKQSLADKIWEIVRTDDLVKLSAFQSRTDVTTRLFSENIGLCWLMKFKNSSFFLSFSFAFLGRLGRWNWNNETMVCSRLSNTRRFKKQGAFDSNATDRFEIFRWFQYANSSRWSDSTRKYRKIFDFCWSLLSKSLKL